MKKREAKAIRSLKKWLERNVKEAMEGQAWHKGREEAFRETLNELDERLNVKDDEHD